MHREGGSVLGWLRVIVWSIAICLAALGVVLAPVSGSAVPLLMFLGLAVPMAPLGTRRSADAVTSRTPAG